MKIQKIEIEQFGGLKNFVLDLSGGAHYLYGENEAGKSTLCAFIAAMFYGLPAKVRGGGLRGDSRSLYMPWGESYMAGTLYFEAGGTEYVLSRRFGSTARGDKTSLMTASDWQAVSISPDEIGKHFLGVGEEAFYKTLFISQMGAAFEKGKEDELMTRLSNLETTGDEDTSVQKALSELERAQYELISKTGRGGTIVQLDGEIEALKTELLEAKQKNLSFKSLLAEIQQMVAEKEVADKKLAALSEQRKVACEFAEYQQYKKALEKQAELSKKLAEEKKSLYEATAEKEALLNKKAEAAPVLALEQDVVLSLAEKEAACGVLEKKQAEEEALSREVAELRLKAEEREPHKSSSLAFPVALSCSMLFLMILAVLLGVIVKPFFFVLAAVFTLGMIFGIIKFMTSLKQRGSNQEALALSATLAEKENALSQMQAAGTGKKLAGIRAEIQAVFEKAQVKSLPALAEKIEGAKALAYQLEGAEKEEARLDASVKAMEQELAAFPQVEAKPEVKYEGPDLTRIDEMVQMLRHEQVQRERELAQKQARVESGFSGTRSVALIESALLEVTEKRRQLFESYEAICLAKTVMAECNEELKNTFAPALNEKSGQLISELTSGKYQEIRVTEDYKIMLKTPGGSEIVPAEFVSAGTYDLLYFALRMAVLKTLFEEIPVLILDDAFMQFDDARQKEAFSWLCGSSAEQVLYFSCHKPADAWTGAVITL